MAEVVARIAEPGKEPSSSKKFEENPRGIPKAPFVDKVEEFVGAENDTEGTLTKLQEMMSKYKYMQSHLLQRKKSLGVKIPEIKESLEMVQFLRNKEDNQVVDAQFELNDTLWANAKIENAESVSLWLGANVMLEYPIEEADQLLSSKLAKAKETMSQVDEDLEFIRDQITTMEVNVARVYNYDVKLRRDAKQQQQK